MYYKTSSTNAAVKEVSFKMYVVKYILHIYLNIRKILNLNVFNFEINFEFKHI